MKKVYICFKSSDLIGGKIIKVLSKSKVSHAAICYESDDWGEDMILEATFNGVVCKKPHDKYKHVFLIKEETAFDKLKVLKPYLGQFYDYIGAVWFAFILIFKNLFRWKKACPKYSFKGQFCSELVAKYFEELGFGFENTQWVTPQELLEICQNNKSLFLDVSDPNNK